MDLRTYKRCFLISDTHLGMRNNAVEWLEIVKDYFYNFFIPLLKKEGKEGDFVLHCGDVFDSRHSLGLFTLNLGVDIFEEIGKIMPVVIILGNHDIARKNTNDVNSLKAFKHIPNIHVYEEPAVIEVSNKKLLLMPWRASKQDEMDCISANPADFLFCHTDIAGLKFNKHTEVHDGLSLEFLNTFRKVYAGHIHFAQQKGNFRMLGNPYQMTRSDMGNAKGIWCFNIETEKETFYENTLSPKFMRLMFDKLLEMEIEDINKLIKNNFVDVLVDTKWSLNFPFSMFTEEINGHRKFEFILRFSDENEEDFLVENESSLEKIDILDLASKLISGTSHSEIIKSKLMDTLRNLYNKVQNTNEEE